MSQKLLGRTTNGHGPCRPSRTFVAPGGSALPRGLGHGASLGSACRPETTGSGGMDQPTAYRSFHSPYPTDFGGTRLESPSAAEGEGPGSVRYRCHPPGVATRRPRLTPLRADHRADPGTEWRAGWPSPG